MKKYTYKNTFHNTTFATIFSPEDLEEIEHRIIQGYAENYEKAFAKRMKKALCGVSGCTCSDTFGIRD